jgi:hypothetical protein
MAFKNRYRLLLGTGIWIELLIVSFNFQGWKQVKWSVVSIRLYEYGQ